MARLLTPHEAAQMILEHRRQQARTDEQARHERQPQKRRMPKASSKKATRTTN